MRRRWMDPIRTLVSRCSSLFRRRRLDADLDEELRAHIIFATEDNIQRGMTRQQARTAALREFGGVTQIRETYRVRRGLPWLEQLGRDLRFGLRQLHRSPGFAATAILTLALGLGANTAVFSLINALLLRPLPVPHAEQLAILSDSRSDFDSPNHAFSAPMFRALERFGARHDVFEDVAAFSDSTLQVRGGSGNQQVPGELVSGQFFATLQTPPLLGRYLTAQDDQPKGSPAGFGVAISESFWRTWFNKAPDVVGRKLTIANTPFTVVGVMPRRFIGADPTQRPEIYVPLSAEPIIDAPYNNIDEGYRSIWLWIIARRKPNVSLQQANAAVQALSNAILEESVPDAESKKDEQTHHFLLTVEPGSKGYTFLREIFGKPLTVVFCLCGVVLLLACLNLTSLLMARAASRERELATRLAIGATRGRLVRQLLVESLLIAVLGTAAGLAISPLVSHSLAAMLLGQFRDMTLDTALDPSVFLFAALITVVAALLTGLFPALRATSGDLNDHIKNGSHTRSKHERYRLLPRLLMGSEVALALMLVVGAGLLAASLTRLYRTGLGFDPKGVVNLDLDMGKQALHGSALIHWYQAFGEALSHQPGVEAVSFDSITPLGGRMETYDMKTPFSNGGIQIDMNDVAPSYFRAMRIPIYEGRDFQWSDTKASGLKIILNQTAAKALFPGRSAVGQTIQFGEGGSYEVIAVVGDVHYISIRKDAPPGAYFPITQGRETGKISYTAVVRIDGTPTRFAAAVRALATSMAPDIPPPVMTTMSSALDASISSERMMAMLSVFFAACALLVTGIGLYGTLAYATARRTSEIGIRMALGAQRTQVVALVFRENAWIAAGGSVVGLIAALLASRALASFLYGTSTRDPWVLVSSVAALIFIASAASLLPALRAARIEPMVALRTE
jgi:predicted permease